MSSKELNTFIDDLQNRQLVMSSRRVFASPLDVGGALLGLRRVRRQRQILEAQHNTARSVAMAYKPYQITNLQGLNKSQGTLLGDLFVEHAAMAAASSNISFLTLRSASIARMYAFVSSAYFLFSAVSSILRNS